MAYIQVAETSGHHVARGPVQGPGLQGGLGLSFDDIVVRVREYVDKAQQAGAVLQQAGGVVEQALNVAMPYYRSQVERYRPWLFDQGQQVGRAVIDKAYAAAKNKVVPKPSPVGPPEPAAPSWVKQAIDPVLEPFVAGVRSEIDPVVYKGAALAGGGLALGGLFMLWLGYQWGRRRAR